MKKVLKNFIAISILGCILLTGCTGGSESKSEITNEKETITIGMSFDSFVIERWQRDRDVFVSTAQALGATVNVQNANGDVDKQIEQIEYFVEKGVDAIVVIPIEAQSLESALRKAKEANIPIICYDRMVNNVDADLYISFDNQMVGTLMGEALVKESIQNVIMLCGPLTDNNVAMVRDGFAEVMQNNNIDILDTYYVDSWKAEYGGAYIYDNMDIVSQADAIMCGNDDVATSVIRSLAVNRLAGQVKVVGQDADLPACQHVVEGVQVMTVYKPVEKLASEAAKLSVKLAKGIDIGVNDTINNGKYDIPYVAIEPIPVTKENIDEIIIDGGFHSREDVYLNVSESEELDTVE